MRSTWFHELTSKILTGLVLAILIDGIWIATVGQRVYLAKLSNIMLNPAHMDQYQWMSAIVAWCALVTGIVFFVLPQAKRSQLCRTAGLGALYGFVVYGTYEFTNFAIFKGWPLTVLAIDMLWGCFFCAILSICLTLIHGKKGS